jgi:hypothetical protein
MKNAVSWWIDQNLPHQPIPVFVPTRTIERIQTELLDKVVALKLTEPGHEDDYRNERKRWLTGLSGEAAMEIMINKSLIDWDAKDSRQFNSPDLRKVGLNIGIKTVEEGKMPLIKKIPKYPEIILIKRSMNDFLVCGLAPEQLMVDNQSDIYVLDPNVIKKNWKTAFTGFGGLRPFKDWASLVALAKEEGAFLREC